jgi:hypothetical protein
MDFIPKESLKVWIEGRGIKYFWATQTPKGMPWVVVAVWQAFDGDVLITLNGKTDSVDLAPWLFYGPIDEPPEMQA